MADQRSLKRPLLYALVVSVILGAILGIIIVLRNKWGWFETRVILTTVIIATASIAGLACDLSRTPRGLNLLPTVGLVLTFLAATLCLFGMWTEFDEEIFWKSTVSITILAVATVHVCLLSIAKLPKRFRWVFFVAWQVIFGLATLLILMICFELDDEPMVRIIATVSIVAAALSLVIPLLHRIGRTEANENLMTPLGERNIAAIDEEIGQLRNRIAKLEKLKIELQGK